MRLPKARTWAMMALTAAFLGLLITEVARESPRNGMRRTEPIRRNLHRLREILFTLERPLAAVHEVNETEQILLMQSAVAHLKEYLLPHLAAEEAVLYPAIERRLPASQAPLTQALIREHQIMRRWIGEMEALANGAMPDHNAFARRGGRLLGLIEAHFEVDEAVLFPVLDEEGPVADSRPRK